MASQGGEALAQPAESPGTAICLWGSLCPAAQGLTRS